MLEIVARERIQMIVGGPKYCDTFRSRNKD
jgi:hypothetical protein